MPHVRTALLLMTLLLAASTAQAQDPPAPVDLFAGYSLLPADGQDFPRQTSHGVHVTVALRVTRWLSVIGDLATQFSTARDLGPGFQGLEAKTRVTEYLTGPRFVARSPAMDVFAHALIGIASGDAGDDFPGFSDSGLTFGGGGGIDVRVQPRLAVRAQFDLLGSFADIVEANPRVAVGLVIGLGRR